MDLFSLGFVLLILVASGVIAYFADRLGKKLGKKRLSLWGLRPKHVATLGTVAMGVMVSFLTIVIVAAASRDAREWLVQGRGLLVEQEKLKKEIKNLQDQRREADEAKGQSTRELAETRQQLGGAESQVKVQKGLLASTRIKRDALNAEVARLTSEVSRTNGVLKAVRSEYRRSQIALKATSARLIAVQRQATTAEGNLALAKKSLTVVQTNLNVALKRQKETAELSFETYKKTLELGSQVKDLEALVKTREGVVDSLRTQTVELGARRKEAEDRNAEAQEKYLALQALLDKTGERIVQLNETAASMESFLSSTTFISRTGAMTFRKGEEVARMVVPGGADVGQVANALSGLLRAARIEAEDRGAKGHKDGGRTYEVADVFDRQDPKTKVVVSAEGLKRSVISRAVGRGEDQVLVATSSLNAFTGEPVSLDVAVMLNPVIYHRNDMVAEARIDGSLTDDRILAQLSEFIRSRVRERATQDRLIPRAWNAAPFGEVPTADLFNVMRDVKKAGRSVRVQALAEADTRAADPLRLEFRVK